LREINNVFLDSRTKVRLVEHEDELMPVTKAINALYKYMGSMADVLVYFDKISEIYIFTYGYYSKGHYLQRSAMAKYKVSTKELKFNQCFKDREKEMEQSLNDEQ
jgi:hypothetical protein